jgi:hypothetical protein
MTSPLAQFSLEFASNELLANYARLAAIKIARRAMTVVIWPR